MKALHNVFEIIRQSAPGSTIFRHMPPILRKKYRTEKGYFGGVDVREIRKMDIINYREHLDKNFDFSEKTAKN